MFITAIFVAGVALSSSYCPAVVGCNVVLFVVKRDMLEHWTCTVHGVGFTPWALT